VSSGKVVDRMPVPNLFLNTGRDAVG